MTGGALCLICEARFTYRTDAEWHVRNIHLGRIERPEDCESGAELSLVNAVRAAAAVWVATGADL